MSIMACDKCGEYIDTDYDVECWVETKYGDKCYCEQCRHLEEAEKARGDEMASKAEDMEKNNGI